MQGKRSKGKRILRWLTAGFLIVLGALGVVLFLLTFSPGEKIIKGIAESKLKGLLQQEVQIGTLETNLLSHVQLKDVRIFQVQSGDTISLLNLDYARAEYRLIHLL